jgi:hypothetical protein
MGSGLLDQIVGRVIDRVPDSRLFYVKILMRESVENVE